MSNRLKHRPARTVGIWGFCVVTVLLVPSALSRESARSELIRFQKQEGLSLVSVRDNKIYVVSFAKRRLGEPQTLPVEGTIINGGLSEDGARIAVASCKGAELTPQTSNRIPCPAGTVLAVLRTDGSDSQVYDNLGNPEYMACWSHDNSKLALVVADRGRGRYTLPELQILDLATGTTQVVPGGTKSFVDPQCWSPDDKQLVYTSDNMATHGRSSIYDVDCKTSREFSVGTRPTWSPDGNWIAVMDCPPSLFGCKYYAVRPSGDERKLLFKSEAATSLWWSPDSRFVAYVNMAGFFERTPSQQLREMVRLRVRRLEDNSVDSFADFFDGDLMEFQWVKKSQFKLTDSH
jgi:WD40 repeat protein